MNFLLPKRKRIDYHVVCNGQLAYRANKVYYLNLTPYNNMNGIRIGFEDHQLQQLSGHDVIIPIFTRLLRQYSNQIIFLEKIKSTLPELYVIKFVVC